MASLYGTNRDVNGRTDPLVTGPGPGLGAMPVGPSGGTAPAPAQNPFSRMFASDAGGLPGLIGMLSGAPTGAEQEQSRLGAGQAKGLASLQERINNGMSTHQAIVDFVASPDGAQFFGTSSDPVGAIKAYIQNTQAPADTFETASPGNVIYSKNTGKVVNANPTADIQTASDIAALAKFTPQETKDFYRAYAGKISTDPNSQTQAEDATKWLLSRNLITPEFAKKKLAGLIQTVPTRDAAGNVTGMTVVDLSDYAQSGNPTDLHATVVGSEHGGLAGDLPAGAAPNDPTTGEPPKVSGDIIFGAGPVAAAASIAGGALGNIDANLAAPQYTNYRTALSTIFADVANMMNVNKQLASEMAMFKNMTDKSGIFSNPYEQGVALLNLHNTVDRRMAIDYGTLTSSDPTVTNDAKTKASEEIQGLKKLKGDMPSQDELYKSIQKFQQGQGSIQQGLKDAGQKVNQVGKAIGDVGSAASGAVTATEKAVEGQGPTEGANAPQEFKTPQDAAAAAKAGTLQPNTPIIVGGIKGTWMKKAKGKK